MDFSFSFKKKPDGPSARAATGFPAQEQYQQLRGCGLNLAGHFTIRDLSVDHPQQAFADAPFSLLLSLMGGLTVKGVPWSHDVWTFVPTEEDGGVNDLLANLPRLSKGALALDGAEVGQNEETGAPVLNLVIGGEPAAYELSPEANAAPQVLSTLAALIAESGGGSRLAMTSTQGGSVFVYVTEEELGELAQATGLEWGWVE